MKKYKKNKKLTRSYLQAAAYRYLERYATTEANLKVVLARKVERIIRELDEADELRPQSESWIDDIVKSAVKNNLVNDLFYARAKAESFLRSGNSLAIMKNKLRSKGVPLDIIEDVVSEFKEQGQDINFLSCIRYARKRRFGPFRTRQENEDTARKETAAMARAGFSYDETKRVLNSNRDELEDILFDA